MIWNGAVKHFFCLGLISSLALFCQSALAQTRIVEIEVSADQQAELHTQQRWMEALTKIGADRVRSRTNPVGKPGIKELGSGKMVVVKVKGVISGNQLVVPGHRFFIGDVEGMRDFVQRLRDDGSKLTLAEKKAFGLTSEQLVDVYKRLSKPVETSTLNQPVSDVLERLLLQSGMETEWDDASRKAIKGDDVVTEQLQGVTTGTAIAAVLRPLGLVMVPQRKQGGTAKLHLVDSRAADEHWPIGWPTEKPLKTYEPKLFDRQNIAIRDYQLDQALAAIQRRVAIPFLYDQNSLARAGIVLGETDVTLVNENLAYMVAIQKLVSQSRPRMRAEMRLDEAGKPFLWFSTAFVQR